MVHWVIPLYKQKSVFEAQNHNGIYLTSELSKCAGRILVTLLVPQLISLN